MEKQLMCPHCGQEITDREFMTLRGRYNAWRRKRVVVPDRTGERKGVLEELEAGVVNVEVPDGMVEVEEVARRAGVDREAVETRALMEMKGSRYRKLGDGRGVVIMEWARGRMKAVGKEWEAAG